MNDVLLGLIDDLDLVGDALTVVELTGTSPERLDLLEAAVSAVSG